jgi:murein DD-endopeptidase MepM/ murein hydrolase activator NlpD
MIKNALLYILFTMVLVGGSSLLVSLKEEKDRFNDLRSAMNYIQQQNRITENPIYGCPIHPEDFKWLSSPYGIRVNPFRPYTGGEKKDHFGLDLVGTWRARITAVAPGDVLDHWIDHETHGKMLRIGHDDGRISEYWHLYITYVREGDRVEQGQVIARQGNS